MAPRASDDGRRTADRIMGGTSMEPLRAVMRTSESVREGFQVGMENGGAGSRTDGSSCGEFRARRGTFLYRRYYIMARYRMVIYSKGGLCRHDREISYPSGVTCRDIHRVNARLRSTASHSSRSTSLSRASSPPARSGRASSLLARARGSARRRPPPPPLPRRCPAHSTHPR